MRARARGRVSQRKLKELDDEDRNREASGALEGLTDDAAAAPGGPAPRSKTAKPTKAAAPAAAGKGKSAGEGAVDAAKEKAVAGGLRAAIANASSLKGLGFLSRGAKK